MHIVLFEPEIPPNTGNIARLCAATSTPLHLVEPLGFKIDDKHLKRAGLDYWPHVNVTVHKDFDSFLASQGPSRLVLTSARGGERYDRFEYAADDWLVLGPETRGLPEAVLNRSPHRVRIPILPVVRSLNLSTSAGILLMEGLRQTGGLDRLAP